MPVIISVLNYARFSCYLLINSRINFRIRCAIVFFSFWLLRHIKSKNVRNEKLKCDKTINFADDLIMFQCFFLLQVKYIINIYILQNINKIYQNTHFCLPLIRWIGCLQLLIQRTHYRANVTDFRG